MPRTRGRARAPHASYAWWQVLQRALMAGYITLQEACAQKWDAVVVGSGPAGLTAALKLAGWRRDVLVLDSGFTRTGMIQWSCNHPAFPDGISGVRLLHKTREQAVRKKAKILRAAAVSLRKVVAKEDEVTGTAPAHTRQNTEEAAARPARHPPLHTFELDVCPVYDRADMELIPVKKACSVAAAGTGIQGQGQGSGERQGEEDAPRAPSRCGIDLFIPDTLRCSCVLLCTGVEDPILPIPGLGPDPLAGGHLRIGPMSDGVTELEDVAVVGSGPHARKLAATLACFARSVTLCMGGLLVQQQAGHEQQPEYLWQDDGEGEREEDELLDMNDDESLVELGIRMIRQPIAHVAMQDRAGTLWAMTGAGALQAEVEPGRPAPVKIVRDEHARELSDPRAPAASASPMSSKISAASTDLSELPASPGVRDWLLAQSVTLTAQQYAQAMATGTTRSSMWPWAGQGAVIQPVNEADAARTAWPQKEGGEGGRGGEGDIDQGSGPNIVRYQIRFAPTPGQCPPCSPHADVTVHELYSGVRPIPRSGLAQQVGAALTPSGHVCVTGHSTMESSIPGLYAAGDVTEGLAEMGVAMGQASLAAAAIQAYLVRRDLALEHGHHGQGTQAKGDVDRRVLEDAAARLCVASVG